MYASVARVTIDNIPLAMAAAALPEQFRPSKSFIFPKRKFGVKGEERSFRAEWCQENDWLHYNVGKDAAFCYTCMKCEHEKKFLSSKKREPAFISKGYMYWKEATTAFKKHQTSDCHGEAVEALLVLPHCIKDIAELQDAEHAAQKALNHRVFMRILNSLRFFVRQGLALRGDGDELDSNFIQLLRLNGLNCVDVDVESWLAKKTNKYTSPDVQNKCLELMSLHILREVSKNIAAASCYSVMADE